MSIFRMINNSIRKIRLIAFTVVIILLFPLSTPILLIRVFVNFIAKVFRKDLGFMIERRKVVFVSNDLILHNSQEKYGDHYGNFVVKLEFSGELSVEKVQKTVTNNLHNENCHLLRQYPQKFMGYLFWKTDDEFHIQNHVRYHDSSSHELGPQNLHQLSDIMTNIITCQWPVGKSPWKIVIIPFYVDEEDENFIRKTIVVFKIHCCLADGDSAMTILERIFGSPSCKFSKSNRNFCTEVLPLYLRLGIFGLYDYLTRMKMCYEKKWHSPIDFTRQKFFVWSHKIPNALIHDLKEAYKVSKSAIILTIVSEGMRKHLIDVGVGVPDKMFVTIPQVNEKNCDYSRVLQNQMCLFPMKFPIYIADPLKRMKKFKKYIIEMKTSTFPEFSRFVNDLFGSVFSGLNYLYSSNLAATSTTFYDFEGPKTPLKFGGCELLDITCAMGQVNGHSGFGFTTISYNGYFRIGLLCNNCIVTSNYEANKIMEKICAEVQKLKVQ